MYFADHFCYYRSTATSASPVQGTPEFVLPSISLHSLARTGVGARRAADREAGVRGLSWATDNPSSSPATWDRTSAAQQLVGLSQDGFMRSGLQHERPVPPPLPQKPMTMLGQQPMCEALDLDDLQNFLSWDMYGIMDMGDPIPDDVAEDLAMHTWAGAV